MQEDLLVIEHSALRSEEIVALVELFDREYLAEHGAWNLDRPYGYSPADVHTLAFVDSKLVGHVGFQRRTIAVGDADVTVAGTGGVLVDASTRGGGLGRRVMDRAQQAMKDDALIDFGYLGCREEVVPFYQSTGWLRIHATESHVFMGDSRKFVVSEGGPILIFPTRERAWPNGDIDLRGTPW